MNYKYWSLEDIKLLYDLYVTKGLSKKEIKPYFLERTIESIWLKIKRLKYRHNKIQTFEIKSRLHTGCKNGMFGKVGPNKGLTKNNSSRIRKAAKKISKARKLGFKTGKLKPMSGSKNPMFGRIAWSRGLTKLTNNILLKASKKQSISKKTIWKNLSEEEKERRSIFLSSLFRLHKRGKKVRTSIEITIQNILEKLLIKFKPAHTMGRFCVDFYLPDYNSVIECFGDYWHCNPSVYKIADKYQLKNIERDHRKIKYLKEKGIPLLFLWEKDIKQSKNIETKIYNFINIKHN